MIFSIDTEPETAVSVNKWAAFGVGGSPILSWPADNESGQEGGPRPYTSGVVHEKRDLADEHSYHAMVTFPRIRSRGQTP